MFWKIGEINGYNRLLYFSNLNTDGAFCYLEIVVSYKSLQVTLKMLKFIYWCVFDFDFQYFWAFPELDLLFGNVKKCYVNFFQYI